MKDQRLYWVWAAMIQRCHNPKNAGYKHYGQRGIGVCDHWRYSFRDFETDMGPRPSGDASIDRIDNAIGYEPNNCRWASRETQNNNRLWCHYYTINGVRLTMKQAWAAHAAPGVTYRTLVKRLVTRGWEIGTALTMPPHPTKGGLKNRRAS